MFNSEILDQISLFSHFKKSNPELTPEQDFIAKTLIATNSSLDKTIFITDASLEEINEIYSLLKDFLSKKKSPTSIGINVINDKDLSSESKRQINRKDALSYVIDNLKQHNSSLTIESQSYNTISAKLNNETTNIKIKLSRNFHEDFVGGWCKEDDRYIKNFDFHIYVVLDDVTQNYKYRVLIFNKAELLDLLSKKNYKNNFVNYYFHWKNVNGHDVIVDNRESTASENNDIDIAFADADLNKKWILK